MDLNEIKPRLYLSPQESVLMGTKYSMPQINIMVLFIGMIAIQQQGKAGGPTMDIFQHLLADLDAEGRYLFINAIANQLRYPNNHTHYFSCVILYLFAESPKKALFQELITRVLLERIIAHMPHPWGLLITFVELMKNPRYNFWQHNFDKFSPEIENVFEGVVRSCLGATQNEGERPAQMPNVSEV